MTPRLGFHGFLLWLLIVVIALGTRAAYLLHCVHHAVGPTPLFVQDSPWPIDADPEKDKDSLLGYANAFDRLVFNLKTQRWFGTVAPLSQVEETSAHVSPGYPVVVGRLAALVDDQTALLQTLRWTQAVLGALTAGFYFLFARRAFGSLAVATLAGLFCACYPFWIINTAEINDGVLASFALAMALFFGTRAAQEGEALTSLLFGLALAGVALVRAPLLPFAVVACLWFLLRCRSAVKGWLCALVAVLGFANGLAPWTIRNYQDEEIGEIVPIVDSMYLHLWMGNLEGATGGSMNEDELPCYLGDERLFALWGAQQQPRRYQMLADEVSEAIQSDPSGFLGKRLDAGMSFVFGARWFQVDEHGRQEKTLAERVPHRDLGEPPALPEPVEQYYAAVLVGSLFTLLLLAFLGWRWSYGWRSEARLATLALLWVPLPYLLAHAEGLSGPRLPLDGVLLTLAAFALACLVPGLGAYLFRGPQLAPVDESL